MRVLKRLRKRDRPATTTIFNKPNRPKIHISSIAAVFQQYNDREKQISMAWDNPWWEESRKARKLNLDRLRKRLENFGLDHRFDFYTYLDGKYD